MKQHIHNIESPFDKRVPHDVEPIEDLNLGEEEPEEEEKDQIPKKEKQDGLLDIS